jgi:biofilm PGA synthesis N-glycosyltransferase PgaC
MDRKYSLVFSFFLIVLLVGALFIYLKTLQIGDVISDPISGWALLVVLILLTAVIGRFFILLWLSYLATLEEVEPGEVEYTPGVTILVPAYNEEMVIKASISSLLSLDYPDFEVLVIDDGSSDATYDVASQFEGDYGKARVRVVTKSNSGKAASLNVGISLAENDYIVCVDSDSKLSQSTLAKGMAHFRNSSVGAVAGNVKVVNRDGIWTKLQALEYIEGLNVVRRAQGFLRLVNIVPGPIGIFRKQALLDVGGYDSDTFAEDCDLTLKLLTKGWKIEYEPDAISYTEAPEKLLDLLKQRYRWTRGILQSIKKHRDFLFHPGRSWVNSAILWYMILEGVFWPTASVIASSFLMALAALRGNVSLIFIWWSQLTLLEMVVALHTVAMEKEDLKLVPYTIFYPLFYILIVNITKTLSGLEELLGLKMTWGKLDRMGKV